MSKNVYFEGQLIPSTSFKGMRIGSKYSTSKEEAKAKFIENIGFVVSLTPQEKNRITSNPSILEVDEEKPSGKESFSKYYIRLKAPQSLQPIHYVDPSLVTEVDPEFVTETVLDARRDAEKWSEEGEGANILNQPEVDQDDFEEKDEDEEGKELLDSSFKKSEKNFKEMSDALDDWDEGLVTHLGNEDKKYYEDDLDDYGGGKRRRRTRKNKRYKKRITKKRITKKRITKKRITKKRKTRRSKSKRKR